MIVQTVYHLGPGLQLLQVLILILSWEVCILFLVVIYIIASECLLISGHHHGTLIFFVTLH